MLVRGSIVYSRSTVMQRWRVIIYTRKMAAGKRLQSKRGFQGSSWGINSMQDFRWWIQIILWCCTTIKKNSIYYIIHEWREKSAAISQKKKYEPAFRQRKSFFSLPLEATWQQKWPKNEWRFMLTWAYTVWPSSSLVKLRAGDMHDSRVQWGCTRKNSDAQSHLVAYLFIILYLLR